MKTFVYASLFAIVAATSVGSAYAAFDQYEDMGVSTIMVHKHQMKIKTIKMADGTVVYGLTRAQLQQMNVRWTEESRSRDGSGR